MKKLFLALVFLLFASSAWPATYYVGQGAGDSDANSCASAQTDANGNRKLTIAGGVACLAASDTLHIKNGTYTPVSNTINPLPSGSSCANPSIMEGQSTAGVIIQPISAVTNVISVNASRSNIAFRTFTIDAVNMRTGETTGIRTANASVATIACVILEDLEIKNMQGPGVVIGASLQGAQIRRNKIHDSVAGVNQSAVGIYYRGANGVIERNEIYNIPEGGITVYCGTSCNDFTPPQNNIVRYNWVHDIGPLATEVTKAIDVAEPNNTIHNNVASGGGDEGFRVASGGNNAKFYNNVSYGNASHGFRCISGNTGIQFKNNISIGNGGSQILDGCGATLVTNLTTGVDTSIFTNPAGNDFTLKADSPAINVGTAIGGYPYNENLPDQGAFETWVHSAAEVGDVDASTVVIDFQNNVFPPVLPVSGCTGFTVKVNSVDRTVNTCTRNGTNQIRLALASAVTNGQTVTYSYSAGNVTDSALIGNSKNQPLHTITDQGVTNHVGAASTHEWRQARFRFHALDGAEASRRAKCGENVNCSVMPGGVIALRMKLVGEVADPPSVGVELRYLLNDATPSCTADTPTLVPAAFGAGNVRVYGSSNPDSAIPAQGTATTRLLTQDYATFVAGAILRDSVAIPSIDLSLNSETEIEWLIEFDSDAAIGDTYDWCMTQQGGTAFTAHTVVPRATIVNPAGSAF